MSFKPPSYGNLPTTTEVGRTGLGISEFHNRFGGMGQKFSLLEPAIKADAVAAMSKTFADENPLLKASPDQHGVFNPFGK